MQLQVVGKWYFFNCGDPKSTSKTYIGRVCKVDLTNKENHKVEVRWQNGLTDWKSASTIRGGED